ncbi:hypothetical protein [Bacteroides graminisolvens]|uniref:hypothetical protein n=1 Tax=Bacteroides graminisolvens TaxID=477666 RepID=UPI002409CC59|nr:hypothetical protein [Bacteroides graminisolvens]
MFIEPVMVDDKKIPEDCTLLAWDEPCLYPVWDFSGKVWVDSGKAVIIDIQEE